MMLSLGVVAAERRQSGRTLGVWPLADRSKKPASDSFIVLTHWALDKRSLSRAASTGI